MFQINLFYLTCIMKGRNFHYGKYKNDFKNKNKKLYVYHLSIMLLFD